MTKSIGSLYFGQSAQIKNRYAQVVCDPSVDGVYSININGTDQNGERVFPLFITVDNYSNTNFVSYSIDGVTGSIAAYTKAVIAINPSMNNITVTLNDGNVTLTFSEQRMPINEGQKFQVTAQTMIAVILNSTTFIIPDSWNNANNKVHCIGSGRDGIASGGVGLTGKGGGAGAYARKENCSFAVGTVVNCNIGQPSDAIDTSFNGAGYLLAKAAFTGVNSYLGGLAISCVGDFKTDGGDGGNGSGAGINGGGGAGGPNAKGLDQLNGTGGNGDSGINGGIGGIFPTNPGGNGITWVRTADGSVYGPGGGGAGGSAASPAGGAAGNYGAGGGGGQDGGAGGAGKKGLIIIEWTP